MDTQKERDRLDEDSINDKGTDVTRSEARQRSHAANEGSNEGSNATHGQGHHHGSDETGSHQEGMYQKNAPQQVVDEQKPTP